jgi:hypothetical protein
MRNRSGSYKLMLAVGCPAGDPGVLQGRQADLHHGDGHRGRAGCAARRVGGGVLPRGAAGCLRR